MKKTVIIILAVLPIVLLITIAFAGRIFSIYRHVAVESVCFIDDKGETVGDDFFFTVNVGETKPTSILILPELASNKSVTYTSQDETICTVDDKGNVTGVSIGPCAIVVKTMDGAKTAMLNVIVTADNVTGVTLPYGELTLVIGTTQTLVPTVEPYAALNKNVTYTSDNESIVTVTPNGKLRAISLGVATVTVTTADGGFTATCTVTVVNGTLPYQFDFTSAPDIIPSGVGYLVSADVLKLYDFVQINDPAISASDIKFRIAAGNAIATLEGDRITFSGNGIVTLVCYTGEEASPANVIELNFMHM